MDTVHVHERIDADLAAPLSLPPPPPQPTTSDAGSEASLPASQLPLAGAPKSKEDEEYLEKLYSEKKIVGTTVGLDLTHKLINAEIERMLTGGSVAGAGKTSAWRDAANGGAGGKKFCDVTKDKPIKVTVRTYVPTKDHPKFNFVGKLLGPKGNSLKRLQEETLTKMAILGRGSMRDKLKEEECRLSLEPRYKHLNDDLHVEITAYAPPAEAHARIALALTEIRRFLVPDYNDDIRHEQLRELQIMKAKLKLSGCGSDRENSAAPKGESSHKAKNHTLPPAASHINNGNHNSVSMNSSSSSTCSSSSISSSSSNSSNQNAASGLNLGLTAALGAAASPLRAVAYPSVLPVMHPAFRGLCKPGQPLTIGHLGPGGTPLMNRFRPNVLQSVAAVAAAAAAANMNRRPSAPVAPVPPPPPMPLLGGHHAGALKDIDHHAVSGVFEFYNNRYNLPPYEGSDGVASPDDRDEAVEDLLASTNGSADFQMLSDGSTLKFNMERSRFRHEPYARYSAKIIT